MPTSAAPTIGYRSMPSGSTYVELTVEGTIASRLSIIPFTLRVGAASLRMDGIGGVETGAEFRNRGYARKTLLAAIEKMQDGDAAISMLYGIRDFYPKFGYATAGPDHLVILRELETKTSLPPGWKSRPFAAEDLPEIQRLYEMNTIRAVGAEVREPSSRAWARLLKTTEPGSTPDCRVAVDPDGRVAAYAWRGTGCWYLGEIEGVEPQALVLSEALAGGSAGGEAILALCRQWAVEEAKSRRHKVNRVVISGPPEGPAAAAARRQAGELVCRYAPCGGSMARVLNVSRLVEALRPELCERLRRSSLPQSGQLRFVTDIGDADFSLEAESVQPAAHSREMSTTRESHGPRHELKLPQWELARLALGAAPPDDILNNLDEPPTEHVRKLVRALFPLRYPHMYIPDRF